MDLVRALKSALQRKDGEKAETLFARLYEENRGLVIYVLTRYLRAREDVEDLLNETFLDFYRSLPSIDGKPGPYLAASARNKAISLLRKRSREAPFPEDYEPSVPDFAKAIAFEEWARRVVGEEDYSIISLHLGEGFDFPELARRTGRKEAEIKSRYYRALRKLREGEGK